MDKAPQHKTVNKSRYKRVIKLNIRTAHIYIDKKKNAQTSVLNGLTSVLVTIRILIVYRLVFNHI